MKYTARFLIISLKDTCEKINLMKNWLVHSSYGIVVSFGYILTLVKYKILLSRAIHFKWSLFAVSFFPPWSTNICKQWKSYILLAVNVSPRVRVFCLSNTRLDIPKKLSKYANNTLRLDPYYQATNNI